MQTIMQKDKLYFNNEILQLCTQGDFCEIVTTKLPKNEKAGTLVVEITYLNCVKIAL